MTPEHSQVPTRLPRVRRPRALTSHAVLLAALSVAALAACAKVGEDVFSKETAPFDEPIRAWFLTHQSKAGEQFFLLMTRAGAPSIVIPFSVAIGVWLRAKLNLKIAGAVLLAPATALALFLSIKAIYRRERPIGGAKLRQKTYSFPSGHAAASAAVPFFCVWGCFPSRGLGLVLLLPFF